jgi:hypothetical protein
VTRDRFERGVRDEPLDRQAGGQRELGRVAGVGDGGRGIVVVARERRQREQRVDACAHQAGGRGLAGGAGRGGAGVRRDRRARARDARR